MSYTQEELEAMEEALAVSNEKEVTPVVYTFREFLCANNECQHRFSLSMRLDQSYQDWQCGPQVVCGCCGGHQDRSSLTVVDMDDWCFTDELTLDGNGTTDAEGRLVDLFEKHARTLNEALVGTFPPLPTKEEIEVMGPVEGEPAWQENYRHQLLKITADACNEEFQKQAEDTIFGTSPVEPLG